MSPEGVEMETRPDNSEEVNDAENAINRHDIIARLDLYLHDSSYQITIVAEVAQGEDLDEETRVSIFNIISIHIHIHIHCVHRFQLQV